ncbi:YdhR family protein [Flagellimonas sp. S3867]|uniref:YdhR family protein n=1 Tax=Flagellimonas sp. S3867 TaxID=2768063 RepID=UPI0016862672|nr:YdhR family protein [Flagellimonas sp. S3867]
MIIQIIKLKSNLSEEELLKRAKEREPQFRAISGLLQKYYVKLDQPGQYGGIYLWDTQESLNAYRVSELASSIPGAYEITEAPNIEIMNILFKLRES